MTAPTRRLHFAVPAVDRVLRLGDMPLVMGVANASPESFSALTSIPPLRC
jgi:hypothetical protein